MEVNIFEMFMSNVANIPGARIDREEYLKKTFKQDFAAELDDIVISGPINAGIPLDEISKIADKAITHETIMASGTSVLVGLPGGLAMLGTVPADAMQSLVHAFIVLQKLMYLYGWENDVIDNCGDMDDETKTMIIIYFGSMFGVKAAKEAFAKLVAVNTVKAAKGAISKVVISSVMKGGIWRSIIIKTIKALGLKTTIKYGAKIGTKLVPVVSGVVSGLFTMATFIPMMKRLKKQIETGKISN